MKLDLQNIRQTGNLDLLARQLVEGFITGLHKSPYHGFSVEFAEHRLYNAGESTRHIDWKVYARTDRLYTKRYEEETNLRCRLVIDNSSSMHYPTESRGKITFSLLAAASLAYLLQRQRDAVGLTVFSDSIEYQGEVKSTPTHLQKMLVHMQALLEQRAENRTTRLPGVLHLIAESIHKRSLVILFSDMFAEADAAEELFAALQHLRHNGHEAIVFHVTDEATELELDFEDRPHEFIDLETGARLKLNPAQIREEYYKRMQEYYSQLKLRCLQLKIDFVEADIRNDLEKVLMTYLVKRSKMR
ncbi:DUF58 domain-containing protein [Cesiribacter andamanensis]|uniref:DUF58 domain-containing protein n=1 Tax=Cesiribacter andamanensis AMV16 TaxID=1279009 RepID=M7N886_9BACT|nr:DUF58 domain-containing protein [Cesiribacter andamanensis]EMR03477.1 hypothetical protein ADICEAN_01410 [Cesiribacter andamanensis AMV16]